MFIPQRVSQRAPQGVPGLPWDGGSHVDESTNSGLGALLGRSGGVSVTTQNVSGELLGALWRRSRSSWGVLGAFFGSIF